MAFSDCKTISEVQEKFRIIYSEDDFVKSESSTPSTEFLRDFEFTREYIDTFTQNRADFVLTNLPTLFGAVNSVFKAVTDVN